MYVHTHIPFTPLNISVGIHYTTGIILIDLQITVVLEVKFDSQSGLLYNLKWLAGVSSAELHDDCQIGQIALFLWADGSNWSISKAWLSVRQFDVRRDICDVQSENLFHFVLTRNDKRCDGRAQLNCDF